MPTQPWITFLRPDPAEEYLVLLTELPLKGFLDLGVFLLSTWRIRDQLRHAPGLLGYSLMARLRRRQFWTLSVWEGEAALRRFVAGSPHGQVMLTLRDKMEQTNFIRWRMQGTEFPPRWQEAFARRDAERGKP